MALNENGGGGLPATMLVGPTGGMPYYGNQGGMLGGNGDWWVIVLFILILAGNWGNNGNNGISAPTYYGEAYTQRGFDQAAVMAGLNSIQAILYSGFGDVQNGLCSGFAGVTATVNGGVNVLQQQLFANQIAEMQAHNSMQAQFAQGSCDNKVQGMQNTQLITDTVRNGNQMIMDKLCQLELDGVKQNYENRIAGMQSVIDGLNARVNASDRRVAMSEEVDALYNRLNNCPVPTTPVYGRTPIFTCNNNQGCGCGA